MYKLAYIIFSDDKDQAKRLESINELSYIHWLRINLSQVKYIKFD